MENSETLSPLPPILCNNPRLKIEAEKIPLWEIFKERRKSPPEPPRSEKEKPREPAPLHPLHLSLSPDHFCLGVDEKTVVYKLRVCNPGDRTIYIKCCGLWDESARLCASWWCFPHTRFLLAPGLEAIIFIKAKPKEFAPIPFAHIGLQLASAHLRDNVVGYFEVPIFVKFLKYIPPGLMGEG